MIILHIGLLVFIVFVWSPSALERPLKQAWQINLFRLYAMLSMGVYLSLLFMGSNPQLLPFLMAMNLLAIVDYMNQSIRVTDLVLATGLAMPAVALHLWWATLPLVGFVIMGLLALKWVLKQWYKKNALGGADIWVIALILWCFGGGSAMVAIYVAIFSSAMMGVLMMLIKQKNRHSYLPFVPFLTLGVWVSYGCGRWLLDWYFVLIQA